MKKSLITTLIALVAFSAWAGAEEAEPKTEAIPQKYAAEKAVAIKIEALTRTDNGFYQAKFRIINPTDKAMIFTGYSEISPITKTEHWQEGKWVEERRVLRCGTGLKSCTIAPGQSAVFQATLEGDKLPSRIGISYAQGVVLGGSPQVQAMVWSEKVGR